MKFFFPVIFSGERSCSSPWAERVYVLCHRWRKVYLLNASAPRQRRVPPPETMGAKLLCLEGKLDAPLHRALQVASESTRMKSTRVTHDYSKARIS